MLFLRFVPCKRTKQTSPVPFHLRFVFHMLNKIISETRFNKPHAIIHIYIYYIQRKVGSNFVCVLYFLSALPHLICQFAHNKNSQFWFIFPFCNCCCSLLLFVHMPLVAVVSASPLCWLIFFKSESCQFKATKRTFKSVFIEVAGVSTKFFENICVWFVQKGKKSTKPIICRKLKIAQVWRIEKFEICWEINMLVCCLYAKSITNRRQSIFHWISQRGFVFRFFLVSSFFAL